MVLTFILCPLIDTFHKIFVLKGKTSSYNKDFNIQWVQKFKLQKIRKRNKHSQSQSSFTVDFNILCFFHKILIIVIFKLNS